MTDLFFRPYLEKLWARGLEELPPDSLGSYHPSVNIALVEKGCKEPVESSDHNASFFYPQSGRLGDVTLALAASLGGRVRYSWPVSSVDLERRYCTGPKGTIVRFQEMISTVPLPNLLSMAGIRLEDDRLLASTEVANVRVGFRGKMRCPYHVVYVPDAHLPFHRVFFPYNVNLRTCPEGCASLSIEYTLPQRGRRLAAGELANTAMGYLNKLGLIEMEKCLTVSELVLSPAYVVYRSEGRKEFAELKQKLKRRGVYLAGRYGMWDYMSMEESFKSGLAAAMRLPLAA